jgi:predicted short-subunit dehydrogenase-like oxidoreductase (DUF2520 family)
VKVVVVGRGKLGRALAQRLEETDSEVSLLRGRASAQKPAGIRSAKNVTYVLAVPDGAIAQVAARLAAHVDETDVVLHCAGARGVDALAACAARGAATAVFHPLVSFASARALPPLSGATFVAQGAPRALRAARRLCALLGAHCVIAPIMGPAYHAAAALLANGSAALAYAGLRILLGLGVPRRSAQRALAGLLATVAVNVAKVGVPAALTGPVARGDTATVRAHVRALSRLSPELARQYRQVQPIIEACAAAQRGTPSASTQKRRASKRAVPRASKTKTQRAVPRASKTTTQRAVPRASKTTTQRHK